MIKNNRAVCPVCNEQINVFKGTYGQALIVHAPKVEKPGQKECEGTGTLIEVHVKELTNGK